MGVSDVEETSEVELCESLRVWKGFGTERAECRFDDGGGWSCRHPFLFSFKLHLATRSILSPGPPNQGSRKLYLSPEPMQSRGAL